MPKRTHDLMLQRGFSKCNRLCFDAWWQDYYPYLRFQNVIGDTSIVCLKMNHGIILSTIMIDQVSASLID